jgi:hypothetical protein
MKVKILHDGLMQPFEAIIHLLISRENHYLITLTVLTMIRFVVCISISLWLISCTNTKNWQGNSTMQAAHATFKELNGKQTFTLNVPDNNIYLAYQFEETEGQLEVSIKSPTEQVFNKQIEYSEANSIHLVNQKGAKYKVTVKGKRAAGAFDIRFVSRNK